MRPKKNLIYITETSFPTKSANIINSVKFCDALSNFYNVKKSGMHCEKHPYKGMFS